MVSLGNSSIVRVDPTVGVPDTTLVDFWRIGFGPLSPLSWQIGDFTGSPATEASTRGLNATINGSSAVSYSDGVFGAVLNLDVDPIEPREALGTITIEQSWSSSTRVAPWAAGGGVDLRMQYQVPSASMSGVAVYSSWTIGISHRVSGVFVWYETALFDLDRPLGGDAIFYDTISGNLIVHGVLSATPSAFHTVAADSAVASTKPWVGWRNIHFTISGQQVHAAVVAANAKYNLTLGTDAADWLLVHFNVELEGTPGGRAAHSLRGLEIALIPAPAPCRDRWLQPFAVNSIWNTAIGSDAAYVPAGIYRDASGMHGPPAEIHNDQDILIATTASDPLTDWIDDSGNFPGMCGATGTVRDHLPMPHDFVTDCVANNNGAAVLLPDNETLVQMQPLYRGTAGAPFIAWWHTGAPQPFPWNVSILGDGALGAHGGSGLSAIGGTIRLDELLEGSPPIAHALKLELWAHAYYYFNYSSGVYATCYTWPAVGCDSYWNAPNIGYNGTNVFIKPGALLAVAPDDAPAVAANLTTEPARRILQALVDYGGYLVDDTGSEEGGGALCMERGVTAELRAAYNVSVAIEDPLTPAGQGSALYWDIVAIFRALSVVVNNGPASIGGGGTPRQPPAAPICGAR